MKNASVKRSINPGVEDVDSILHQSLVFGLIGTGWENYRVVVLSEVSQTAVDFRIIFAGFVYCRLEIITYNTSGNTTQKLQIICQRIEKIGTLLTPAGLGPSCNYPSITF